MAAAAPVQPSAPHQGVLARHPLPFYFVIAYAGSWLVWLPLALSEDGTGLLPFGIPVLLMTYGYAAFLGPFLSGFVMTGATEGRAGLGRLLRRFVLWRVGIRWYLFVLLGVPAIFALAAVLLPGTLGSFEGLAPLVTDYGTTVPMAIGFGVLALLVTALTRGQLGYERYRLDVLVPATVHGKGADQMI